MTDFSEKYKVKDEISHILDRSGMWIGSTITESITAPIFFPSKNRFEMRDNVLYNAGLEKLIDEVFSNSIDEYRRSKSAKKASLYDISKIDVTINEDGYCCIQDNGGIPIQKHSETGLYIPMMIFGMLRTSSNYDDSQEKEWVGTNGLGAKVTNIFSLWFQVETNDGKNYYRCKWENNMRDVIEEVIVSAGSDEALLKSHGTRISFKIDLKRFELEKFEVGMIRLFQKHCIDSAASNQGLIINFKSDIADGKLNSEWKFDNFIDYIKLFLESENDPNDVLQIKSGNDRIWLYFGKGIDDIGFVNGALCNRGTHIKKIQKQVVDKMLSYCSKNNMELITEKDILSRFTVFVNCIIHNPVYDSQAKTCLATKIESHKLKIDDKSLNDITHSNLSEYLKDYYNIKYKEEKKKELRKLNSTIKATKSKKLITAGVKDKDKNELWIFEGNSAASGFRKQRTIFQAAYLLRGKIKNTLNLSRTQVLENQELKEIIAILGLQFEKPDENIKNCQYDKIVFCTDSDYDGHHIVGLLISFFAKHFPELFKDRIYRALSPIITVIDKGKTHYYYTMPEYEKVKDTFSKSADIQYTKGLGGLSDIDYKDMLQNPKLMKLILTKDDLTAIDIWFNKSTDIRKEILMNENSED